VRVSLAKLNNDQVHAVAAFTSAAEAVIQTRRPVEVKPEERRYRLVVDGKLVQVFSRRSGDWQLTDATQPLVPDTDAVVFVDFSVEPTQFYPVPAAWFREDVAKRYAAHLARVGTRPRNPDSRHHAVHTEHVAQWRGRWEDALRDAES
jgi:hypothetical protein